MKDPRAHRLRPRTRLILFGVVPALLLGSAGCGGDGDPTGPEGLDLADLAGQWTATVYEFSPENGPDHAPVDLPAEGFSVTLDIESTGRFVLTTNSPRGLTEVETGTLGFDAEAEDFLLVAFDDEPGDESEFFFVIVSEDSFRLVDTTGEGEFDFDGDGVEERARINSTWVRS